MNYFIKSIKRPFFLLKWGSCLSALSGQIPLDCCTRGPCHPYLHIGNYLSRLICQRDPVINHCSDQYAAYAFIIPLRRLLGWSCQWNRNKGRNILRWLRGGNVCWGKKEELKRRKYSSTERGREFCTLRKGEVCDRFIWMPRNVVQKVTHLSRGRVV